MEKIIENLTVDTENIPASTAEKKIAAEKTKPSDFPADFKQKFLFLPSDIALLPRFFELTGNSKGATPKGWNKPENQKFYSNFKNKYPLGYDISGHGAGDDFLVFDFDHVLDANGVFLNKNVADFVDGLKKTFDRIYIEKSVSKTGLHVIFKPTAGKFKRLAPAVLYFDDAHEKNSPKLEIFYKMTSKYFIFTGDWCGGLRNDTPSGAEVDNYIQEVLDKIQEQNGKQKKSASQNIFPSDTQKTVSAEQKSPVVKNSDYDDPPEYIHDLALALFTAINAADSERGEWLPCVSAMKNCGYSMEELRGLCENSPHYNAKNFPAEIDSLKDKNFYIHTLIGKKPLYFDISAYKKQWYKDHPEFSKNKSRRADDRAFTKNISENTQIESLKAELKKIEKEIADLEQEKSAAIEKLKTATDFSKDSVFDDDFVTAAAFAKLNNRKVFADIKINIQNHNKSDKFLTEWNADVKDKVDEIKERENNLQAQKNSLQAQITSTEFFSADNVLKNFVIPEGYCISDKGIYKVAGEKLIPVCLRPAYIKCRFYDTESKKSKLILSYKSSSGKWRDVPAQTADVIFNAKKLVDLSQYNFPVTSSKASLLTDFFDAFKNLNEDKFDLTYTVSQCGWHNFSGHDYFIDPRRKCEITDDDRKVNVTVDDSNIFAHSLKFVGSLAEWKKAYDLAKNSPVARLNVAAAVAPPLLEKLGERNFVLYTHGKTRGGKSTALNLAASAVGNTDIVISFDGTNNGLLATAAETRDYCFCVDEKQSADKHLKDQFQRFIYNVANGKERQRADKFGLARTIRTWRNITLANGETELLDDNATGGAHTRLLQVHAPDTILDSDTCKKIREIIKKNHGVVFPLVIDQILKVGDEELNKQFDDIVSTYTKQFTEILPEYCEYLAILTLADYLLNMVLGNSTAIEDSFDLAENIFPLIPTLAEIDDTQREIDFVLGFITQNQKCFLGATNATVDKMPAVYGKFEDDFVYITVAALKQFCFDSNIDYKKLVTDLVKDNFIIPNNKIGKGRKTALSTVLKKINGGNANCYRIPSKLINGDDSEVIQ